MFSWLNIWRLLTSPVFLGDVNFDYLDNFSILYNTAFFFLTINKQCKGRYLKTMQISSSSFHFPLNWAAIDDYWLIQFFSWWFQNNKYSTLALLPHLPVSLQHYTINETPSFLLHPGMYVLLVQTYECLFSPIVYNSFLF